MKNHSGIQLSTVVFHILLSHLPVQKHVTLRKIGGHVVFANSQSGSFRSVIPQSILRITHYAIPQSINTLSLQDSRWNCLMTALDLFCAWTYSLYFWPSFVFIYRCHSRCFFLTANLKSSQYLPLVSPGDVVDLATYTISV